MSVFSPYSIRMWENTDQNNSEYGHFSRSDCFQVTVNWLIISTSKISTQICSQKLPQKYSWWILAALLKADSTIDLILSSNVSVMNMFCTSGGFHIEFLLFVLSCRRKSRWIFQFMTSESTVVKEIKGC